MKGTAHNSRTNACAAPIASQHSTYARRCSTGQHQPGREERRGALYLKRGGGVGPTKERVCRFRSHLRAKHRRQFEILAVRFLRVPPLMQSVGSGVMGWVLEQGKCSQNLGQQAVVHRAARRTFESKCCRRSSAQLLRTPPPETHRASSFVPQMRRIMMWTVLGAHSTHSTTTTKIIWAAESKAPRPLEQHWTRRVSEPVRRLPFWVGTGNEKNARYTYFNALYVYTGRPPAQHSSPAYSRAVQRHSTVPKESLYSSPLRRLSSSIVTSWSASDCTTAPFLHVQERSRRPNAWYGALAALSASQ